jgi:hypothetical protein
MLRANERMLVQSVAEFYIRDAGLSTPTPTPAAKVRVALQARSDKSLVCPRNLP